MSFKLLIMSNILFLLSLKVPMSLLYTFSLLSTRNFPVSSACGGICDSAEFNNCFAVVE